jgi:threonine dehydrogenase-like Zn-dependent dehydrogenase
MKGRMRAAAIDYNSHCINLRDVAPPAAPDPGQVLIRIRQAGVCGTDREQAAFRLGHPPPGESFLIPGHEALGQVEAVGQRVDSLSPGDWVVPMVRRSCAAACAMCAANRRDLCITGFTERGIFGAHGYLAELALDDAADLVRVPPQAAAHAVLIEPLSVVEKAVETALRLHPAQPRTALVIGAGPIGLLAAMTLTLRGLTVVIHSIEPRSDPRAQLAELAGIRYLESSAALDRVDLVFEAAGVSQAAFLAIDRLAPNGVCAILGSRDGSGDMPFRRAVLFNQTIFGSVNAAPEHFRLAAANLARLDASILDAMITRVPFHRFPETLGAPGIKVVHVLD